YNFFLDSFAHAAGLLGDGLVLPHHTLLLPVGISFYTFQTLSYTIDIYRGRLEPARGFLRFALFVSFFPQLVAGPIVRASHFLPQLDRDPQFDDHAAQRGLGRILVGLCKKCCIADVLGVALVDPTFADPSAFGSLHLAIAMYAYAFQIYYDFSGYSDIAIGAAKMFGFDLPINFDRPYLATSLGDFWRRWHISLSTWLRDYLYFPLGGSRGSTMRVAFNLAVVMLLGGLRHGAAWGFVVWGAIHGVLLGAGRVFRSLTGVNPDRDEQPAVSRIVRILVTFHLVAGCLVVFRAQDWGVIQDYFTTLAAVRPGSVEVTPIAMAVLMVAALWEVMPRTWITRVAVTLIRLPSPVQTGAVTVCLLVFAALGGASPPFIYFQF
ncbi:MAG: MBOAT family protein, partial [Planctomycetes bacterium]|nr:MBOAT family protein [Planctomycetota bacterium]